MVVHGAGTGVTPGALVTPPMALAPVGTMTGGVRVIVDGIAVTMPGFLGTHLAQIPVKQESAEEISDSEVPRELMQEVMCDVAFLLGQ